MLCLSLKLLSATIVEPSEPYRIDVKSVLITSSNHIKFYSACLVIRVHRELFYCDTQYKCLKDFNLPIRDRHNTVA